MVPTLADKQSVPITVSGNFTALNNASYIATATLTVTDPTPSEGVGFEVLVRNGTATVGGTGYIAGQVIRRVYHSGAWSNTVQAAIGTAQTFSALQTFNNGLTVSSGTTALQATTCTTLDASSSLNLSANAPGAYVPLNITNTNAGGYAQINLTSGTLNASLNVATGLFYKFYQNGSVPWQWESASGVVASLTAAGAATFAAGVTCTTLTTSGNVGIGVTPGATLDILAGTTGRFRYSTDGTNGSFLDFIDAGATAHESVRMRAKEMSFWVRAAGTPAPTAGLTLTETLATFSAGVTCTALTASSATTAVLEATTSATNQFSVLRVKNTGASGRIYDIATAGSTVGGPYGTGMYFYDGTAAAVRGWLASDGSWVFGPTDPGGSELLRVGGGIRASGNATIQGAIESQGIFAGGATGSTLGRILYASAASGTHAVYIGKAESNNNSGVLGWDATNSRFGMSVYGSNPTVAVGASNTLGFYNVTPVARAAAAAAATDPATTQALANSLRTILIDLGLAS